MAIEIAHDGVRHDPVYYMGHPCHWFALSAKVEKICHDDKRVSGVQVNGEIVEANYVLCGADAVVAHDELIDGHQTRQKRLNRLEPSLSGMVFLWGVRAKQPALAHHNIIFSNDYNAEFKQIFKHRKVPDEPTIYIAITSKADTAHAPVDGEKPIANR